MKLRIQDSSVRFRITLKELEQLIQYGRIETRTESVDPATGELEGSFVYGVSIEPGWVESSCRLDAGRIWLGLCPRDVKTLNEPGQEGVYLRREAGNHRFMAFVEKDRPAGKCKKPESWIYEQRAGSVLETRPIAAPLCK